MTVAQLCPQLAIAAPPGPVPAAPSSRGANVAQTVAPGLAMQKLDALVDQVAASPASVLILGETGAGKEVTARRVHERSKRQGAFIALNCAALPETLLESELFGYEKGAFTGAQTAKPGLIEAASGGTLFLDELGEMPLTTQAKLLRVLEERTVQRVGSVTPKAVDLRLVAATNRDLQEEIREKRFRTDLYYRLNAIVLHVPPLRERKSEIRSLVTTLAQKAAEALGRPAPAFPSEVLAALERHPWPGNVRELRNTVERLVLLAQGTVVSMEDLPDEVRGPSARPARLPALTWSEDTLVRGTGSGGVTVAPPAPDNTLEGEVALLERAKIQDALERCAGNQTRAAAMLGITRRVLIRKLEKYNVPRPRK